MSYLDHDGLAYFKSKLDRTFIADIVFDDGDILLYGGDGTLLKTVVQEGTVTQKKSTANKEYPVLLCWDADAEEDQTMKTVWYGLDARINPKYGYLYARRYYTEHPSYERTEVPSVRTEWHHIFTDAVSAPMGEVYEYLDRVTDGGEHRMELRLYGNPLSQYVDTPNHNEATDVVSLGVGATRGEKFTFFGYAPSTPIYLEDGTTIRKSIVRGDQYGKDIITRDWLNLNGSITGLVHTYMDETIDGYKTFLKTVTIDSGNDNAKAGLNVQGDVNIDSGDNTKPSNLYVQGNSHIHGNEDIDGNLNVDGISTLDGNVHMKHNLDVDGNLNVDGTSDQHGNVHMYSNLDVDGNANTDGNQTIGGILTVTGKITGNGGAEISGGNGLKVNGNETITGNLTVGGTTTTEDLTVNDDATIGDNLTVNGDELVKGNETVNGNTNVGGLINKILNNTTQEYVTYVTNQPATREIISQNLISIGSGLAKDAEGKIYVDFSQMPTDKFNALLKSLKMQVPLTSDLTLYVNKSHEAASDTIEEGRGSSNKPFKTIQACVSWATEYYAIGQYNVFISISSDTYDEAVTLPQYNRSNGYFYLKATNSSNPPTINCSVATKQNCLSVKGYWMIQRINLLLRSADDGYSGNQYIHGIIARDNGIAQLYGCNVDVACSSDPNNRICANVFCAVDGGTIIFEPFGSYEPSVKYNVGNGQYLWVFNVDEGTIAFNGSFDNSLSYDIACEGSASIFIRAVNKGLITTKGGGPYYMHPVVTSGKTCTGKKYEIASNSGAHLSSQSSYLGNSDGSVETETYSWVK